MKHTPRIHWKNATKTAPLQPKQTPSGKEDREPQLKISDCPTNCSDIDKARRLAIDALGDLKTCGAAAVALSVMNAVQIKQFSTTFGGWDDYEVELFQDGNLELPRLLAWRFCSILEQWSNSVEQDFENMKVADVIAESQAFGNETETAVAAIKHLLEIQSTAFGAANLQSDSWGALHGVEDQLRLAFDGAHDACNEFNSLRLPISETNAKAA